MQVLSKIKDIAAKADKVKLCATGAAVACAAALMITFAVNSSSDDESVDTKPASQTASAGEQTQQTQKLDIVQFRKAPLSDYDMAQTQVKTSGDKTEEKSEKITKNYEEFFKEALPEAEEILDTKVLKNNELRLEKKSLQESLAGKDDEISKLHEQQSSSDELQQGLQLRLST